MKELIGVLVLATSFTCLAQVSIGTPTPHPSAALEINSTTKGFLLPRMTELQMISIDNATEGLMVYCSDCSKKGIYVFNGSEFAEITIDNSESILSELEDLINIANFPAFGGTPSLEDLAAFGIVGATESQISYEEAIAQATPAPETIEDLQIIINAVNALIPPTITSGEIAQTITENIGSHQEVYTVTATDLTGVGSFGIGGLDSSSFSIDPISGAVYLIPNPDFETQAVYTFSVTATDVDGNTCLPFPVSLSVNDADDLERKWGFVRYILMRGTDENGLYNNVGELDILDLDGNNLIDNGILILDDFTYFYGGGYYPSQDGAKLFDNVISNAYANNTFSSNSGQKWILIDLNQTVEIGALTIQARSNSASHIERIKHITVFASDRADSGFTYSGTQNTNNSNENLTINISSYLMKTDTTLWWCSLEEFNENNNPITFVKARQLIDTIKPIITSDSVATPIIENSGAGQEVYTITTTHFQDVTSYVIGGTDASSFSIDQNTGVVTLIVNPDFEVQESYNFNITASDADGNSSTTNTIVLNILDLDDEAPIITSSLVANSIDENSGTGQIVYTATATDNIGVTNYAIGEITASLIEIDEFGNTYRETTVSIDDNSTFTVDENGLVTFHINPNFELYNRYSFEINASDAQGNESPWVTIELNINDKNDNTQVEWGQVRYILLKGDAYWPYFNNIGEVDILDTNGVNLIDNGTLNVNDFTYDYANGHYPGQGGENLFDESASSAYANSQSNISIDREKWVLVDLNMSVELGALTIQARSNHPAHIERITHMTVFASDNADDFTFTTDYYGEVLMDQSTSQMKGNEAIRWRDLDEFTTTNTSITYENARQQIETD